MAALRSLDFRVEGSTATALPFAVSLRMEVGGGEASGDGFTGWEVAGCTNAGWVIGDGSGGCCSAEGGAAASLGTEVGVGVSESSMEVQQNNC